MFCFSFLSLVLFSSISFSFDTTIKSNFDVSFFIQKLTQNHSEDTGFFAFKLVKEYHLLAHDLF